MKKFALGMIRQSSVFGVLAIVCLLIAYQATAEEIGVEPQANVEVKAYTVAVLPFIATGKTFEQLAPQISDLVNLHLSTQDHLALVERAELKKLLGEIELGQSGTVSPDTAAKIGHLTGSDILITGRVFAVTNELYVVAKVIAVETGKVFGEAVSFSFRKSHDAASKTLAEKISSSIAKRGDTFFYSAQVDDTSFLESLMVMAEGKDLPTVSVTVAERHVNRPTMDPAAETEISLLLQQLGFNLVEAATTTIQPDIEIRGEAFSEFAMRRGNLVSCKARVEVKVVERLTGKIIAIDRQTDVAVDVSEQIAAKSAIQKASAKIAERVILRILKSLEQTG